MGPMKGGGIIQKEQVFTFVYDWGESRDWNDWRS